ncbi:MAG: putative Ig domain-containing protein [Bacteroidota bacterium]|nr:putative Ig domain-containing protein [Bacteroidota bacterium]
MKRTFKQNIRTFAINGCMLAMVSPFSVFGQGTAGNEIPNQQKLSDSLRSFILTPKESESPRINGPRVFGVRPGSAFLYSIPATGKRPMRFLAVNLPAGLKLDGKTGYIRGALVKKGEYVVTLYAKNSLGTAKRKFRIVVGNRIGLTPAMGWNSWNCWGSSVSQDKVISSAHSFVEKGLKNHGWSYINIDDGWQSIRGGKFNGIQPNSKFPDMKALADSIHAMGLRFGIYSGPWIGTYAGHIGSYCDNQDGTYDWIKAGNHNEFYRYGTNDSIWKKRRPVMFKHGKYSFVENDVKQWNDWGVDYLKYDWNPNDTFHVDEMRKFLRQEKRDIIYSLSNSAPFAFAKNWSELANSWRTTGDINDSWKSLSKIGFNQDKWASFNGPGHFNDPDMLVVGYVGWGPKLHCTKLTVDEQYTHISLWCLLSAPLLIGCDLAKLDDFTISLLTNDEVLDIDQDPLGKQAVLVAQQGDLDVYSKPLEDGSIAVGLFNKGTDKAVVSAKWSDLKISGKQIVRDLWRQKNLGTFNNKFEAEVAPHGVLLVKIKPSRS